MSNPRKDTFSIKWSCFWLVFFCLHAGFPSLSACAVLHSMISIPLFVASAVVPGYVVGHRVTVFFFYFLAESWLQGTPLIYISWYAPLSHVPNLILARFLKNMHLKIHGMCVSQAWDEIQAYPEIWWYSFACRKHMLIEFGTKRKKLNRKENIHSSCMGQLVPFIPLLSPHLFCGLLYTPLMFFSSICFLLHRIGFYLVLSYHANALGRPGQIVFHCTPN